ncbi:hypothetical protein F5X99DRAFT_404523 [Biscogniauxia marginata]|nr:hypothetical protein F5X99DRAFT_404523 [Biscogniauxia marginata]
MLQDSAIQQPLFGELSQMFRFLTGLKVSSNGMLALKAAQTKVRNFDAIMLSTPNCAGDLPSSIRSAGIRIGPDKRFRISPQHGDLQRAGICHDAELLLRGSYQDDDCIAKPSAYELLTRNEVHSVCNTLDKCTALSGSSEENRLFARTMTASFFVDNISHHFPASYKVHTNGAFNYVLYTTQERVFLVAGGDIATTAMTAPILYLSRNPVCYYASGRRDPVHVVKRQRYQERAAASELPLPPCLALTKPFVATDEAPLVIDGHYVHRGTLFSVIMYVLSYNAAIFPEPFAFNSGRWRSPSSANSGPAESDEAAWESMLEEAFASFSIGPRNSVGKPLAYLRDLHLSY